MRPLLLAVLLAALAGCTTNAVRSYPEPAPMKTVVPHPDPYEPRPQGAAGQLPRETRPQGAAAQLPREDSAREKVEEEMKVMLGRKVALEPPVTATFVWIDRADAARQSVLPEDTRIEIAKRFTSALPPETFREVSEIPSSFAPQTLSVVDVDELRGVAARFQSDVLIVLNSSSARYNDFNFLAWSYFALVPALFVPGQDVAVYSIADACVFDVRTGLALGCRRGLGKAELAYARPMSVSGYLGSLAGEAMSDAVRNLPDELAALIPKRPPRR